tara:strand:- start:37 stop:753 length:717 start_codon:yes stop_codon:yes gene_type:complete
MKINEYKNNLINADSLNILKNMIKNNNQYDLIIIDPPYNENKSKGEYQDRWKNIDNKFLWAGKKHSGYLQFLNERLVLTKDIMTEESCIMVFIGDQEYHRVRILMEIIFSEENYIGTILWNSNNNSQQSKKINRIHEYVLVFSKNKSKFKGLYTKPFSKKDELQNFANTLNCSSYEEKLKKYQDFLKELVTKMKKENDNSYKDIQKYKYLMPNNNCIFRDNSSSDPRKGTFFNLTHRF